MDFLGFVNSDFDFFKKKSLMNKLEYDEKREELKRHFREFCYQIQKNYHVINGGTLLFDKDFQGLNRNKSLVSAKSKISDIDFINLSIDLCHENISINLTIPPDGDYMKLEAFKSVLVNKREIMTRFFKENKHMFILLYKRNYKKQGDDVWTEEYKFENSELCLGNYETLIENIDKIQPNPINMKKLAGTQIRVQFSKTDATKTGKLLASRACGEIIKMLNLCNSIK
jgi:hypothetical protein